MDHCRGAKREGGYILYDVVIQSPTRMSMAVPRPLIGSLTMVQVIVLCSRVNRKSDKHC